MADQNTLQLIDRIPDEQEIRHRLAENLREASLLRKLLRIAKEKTDTSTERRSSGKAVQHAVA